MAHCGGIRSGRRDVRGKPRTYGESPDKLVGPTGGPGGGVDGEARKEAKVGISRGVWSAGVQNIIISKVPQSSGRYK